MASALQENSKPRNRATTICTLVSVICLGLATRRFDQTLPAFVVSHFGDALWTVAAYLSLAFVFPRWNSLRLGLVAYGLSICVEFSQLLDWPWLNAIRATKFGHLVLGSDFVWIDLVRYFCGAATATVFDWLWHRWLKQSASQSSVSAQ